MKELMKIKTSFAEPGMIIGKDIYSASDYLIAGEGATLTDRMITRLKFYSVEEIVVFTPESLRKKEKPKPTFKNKPVIVPEGSSYVGRIKASSEYRTFSTTFYSSFVSYREHVNEVIQNKAPLNTESMLADVSKVFGSCQNPSSLLDMMMVIRQVDDATYVHSMNVALICNLFAHWLKYDKAETEALTLAGLLHDLGKMLIPPSIIKKPGKLTDDEFRVIQEHPLLGYNILKDQKNIDPRIAKAALQHHERCDGKGYPNKLTLNEIEPFAKIVAIADVYDALTANRVYRGPICPLEVIGIFQSDGLTTYDPGFLMTFLDQIMYSYLNYTVKLSNGETGRIIMMQRNQLDKPVIALDDDRYIDLRDEPGLSIVGVV